MLLEASVRTWGLVWYAQISGSSQNPGSSVLDELQLSNGLLWKAGEETITVIHPAGDKGMNKFLQVLTGNKTSNSCNVFEMIVCWFSYCFDMTTETKVCLQNHTIESILTSCITVWYGACNASCRKSLQRIVRAAEKIVGVSLPSLQDIYNTRLTRKALSIAGDPTHPTHNFFSLLPSGRRLRSLQARTNRLKDSFIHQAVRKLNSLPSLPPLPSLTPRITELWPPPHHHHHPHERTHTHTHTHTHTLTHSHWDKHRSLVQHCTLLVTLNSLDKLFALHLYSTLFVCLFISLICTICHVPYATLSIFYIIFIFFI